jgi:hypothetical protein
MHPVAAELLKHETILRDVVDHATPGDAAGSHILLQRIQRCIRRR